MFLPCNISEDISPIYINRAGYDAHGPHQITNMVDNSSSDIFSNFQDSYQDQVYFLSPSTGYYEILTTKARVSIEEASIIF